MACQLEICSKKNMLPEAPTLKSRQLQRLKDPNKWKGNEEDRPDTKRYLWVPACH
jgi:hypothetical protein